MRALVLSGGGSHGAFQAGVLDHVMGTLGTDYDLVCGVSVGAINSAFLAQFAPGAPKVASDALLAMWARVTDDSVRKRWCPFGMAEALWKQSIYNSQPLQDWVHRELDGARIAASGRKLRVVSTSWSSGEAFVATESAGTGVPDWVIASSSFPVFLSPISIGGQLWTDGGLRSVTPLGEAFRAGADTIDMVLCSNPFAADPFDASGKAAIPGLLLRAVSIMSDEVSRADLKVAGLKNDLALLVPRYRKVPIRLIQPLATLPIDSLEFGQDGIQQMVALGREAAKGGWTTP